MYVVSIPPYLDLSACSLKRPAEELVREASKPLKDVCSPHISYFPEPGVSRPPINRHFETTLLYINESDPLVYLLKLGRQDGGTT